MNLWKIMVILACLPAFVHSEREIVTLHHSSTIVTCRPGEEVLLFKKCARVDGLVIKNEFDQHATLSYVDGNFSANCTVGNEGFYICINNGPSDKGYIHLVSERKVKTSSENPRVNLYEKLRNNTPSKDIMIYLKSLCTTWICDEMLKLYEISLVLEERKVNTSLESPGVILYGMLMNDTVGLEDIMTYLNNSCKGNSSCERNINKLNRIGPKPSSNEEWIMGITIAILVIVILILVYDKFRPIPFKCRENRALLDSSYDVDIKIKNDIDGHKDDIDGYDEDVVSNLIAPFSVESQESISMERSHLRKNTV